MEEAELCCVAFCTADGVCAPHGAPSHLKSSSEESFTKQLDIQVPNHGDLFWALSLQVVDPEPRLLGEPETGIHKSPGHDGSQDKPGMTCWTFPPGLSLLLEPAALESWKGVISSLFCSQGALSWPECHPILAAARIPAAQADLGGSLTPALTCGGGRSRGGECSSLGQRLHPSLLPLSSG